MHIKNDRTDPQDLIALVETALIASAKEAAKIAKATGTPLVSKDSGGIAVIPPGLVLDRTPGTHPRSPQRAQTRNRKSVAGTYRGGNGRERDWLMTGQGGRCGGFFGGSIALYNKRR